MELVLDASAALAWLAKRADPTEDQLAYAALRHLQSQGAVVPALWFHEVANGALVIERRGGGIRFVSAAYFGFVETLPIEQDTARPSALVGTVVALARSYNLTAYDATYLELVLRTGRELATFDGQLADAVRSAGGRVFGDPA
jgi:predicted nucleic acid-binding protein